MRLARFIPWKRRSGEHQCGGRLELHRADEGECSVVQAENGHETGPFLALARADSTTTTAPDNVGMRGGLRHPSFVNAVFARGAVVVDLRLYHVTLWLYGHLAQALKRVNDNVAPSQLADWIMDNVPPAPADRGGVSCVAAYRVAECRRARESRETDPADRTLPEDRRRDDSSCSASAHFTAVPGGLPVRTIRCTGRGAEILFAHGLAAGPAISFPALTIKDVAAAPLAAANDLAVDPLFGPSTPHRKPRTTPVILLDRLNQPLPSALSSMRRRAPTALWPRLLSRRLGLLAWSRPVDQDSLHISLSPLAARRCHQMQASTGKHRTLNIRDLDL